MCGALPSDHDSAKGATHQHQRIKKQKGKIENNKSDKQMVHKLHIVSDYGKKKNQYQYHF